MIRTIKFRGKSNDEWVYGLLLRSDKLETGKVHKSIEWTPKMKIIGNIYDNKDLLKEE